MPVLSNRERIGTVVGGRYEIKKLLGEGGMGAVFEAQHRFTKRRVALKVLQPEYAQNADATARFLQEAQAATAINHVNIVQVLDMGVDETSIVYLVLEYLAGEDLAARLHSLQRLSVQETFDVLLPVMNALAVAHSKGIIHRDLKPANIFLAQTDDGAIVPKLLDFGISKISTGEALARTSTGAILGTPYYMAPEQARGERAVDRQVDIWAMGVVMYQCISGQLPLVADNYNQMILKLVMEEAPPIASLVPSLPKPVADLVHRALAKDRAQRFATMEDFVRAVLGFLKSNNTQQFRALQSLATIESDPTVASMSTFESASATQNAQPVRPANTLASMSGSGRMLPDAGAPVVPPTHMNWEGRGSESGAPKKAPRAAMLIGAVAIALVGIVATVKLTGSSERATTPVVRPTPTTSAAVTPPPPNAPSVPVAPPAVTHPATEPAPASALSPGTTPTPVAPPPAPVHAAPTLGTTIAPVVHTVTGATRSVRGSRTNRPPTQNASSPTTTTRSGPGMMGWGER